MKILAIDTSSKVCSVAILGDTQTIIEKHSEKETTHSENLMPFVDSLLKMTKLTLADFDLFACCITGVRIGVATMKAFCDVTKKQVASVSSLESLAYNTLDSHYTEDASFVLSMIDAKNDNVYYGLFQRKENTFSLIEELGAKEIHTVIDLLKKYHTSPILFVGDGSKTHQYLLQQSFSRATFVEEKYNKQTASNIGKAGYYHFLQGNVR